MSQSGSAIRIIYFNDDRYHLRGLVFCIVGTLSCIPVCRNAVHCEKGAKDFARLLHNAPHMICDNSIEYSMENDASMFGIFD
mmetsp:Transcript_430/g.774  ORF Transcript_430/g.774 Transcript_430/m.774 type:complete len:82 (-) Transcript_430:2248-2493(-)